MPLSPHTVNARASEKSAMVDQTRRRGKRSGVDVKTARVGGARRRQETDASKIQRITRLKERKTGGKKEKWLRPPCTRRPPCNQTQSTDSFKSTQIHTASGAFGRECVGRHLRLPFDAIIALQLTMQGRHGAISLAAHSNGSSSSPSGMLCPSGVSSNRLLQWCQLC